MKRLQSPKRTLEPSRVVECSLMILAALGAAIAPARLCADPVQVDVSTEQTRDVVRQAQDALIRTIDRIAPAAVCVFDEMEQGGGSGVIITPDGYGLTNYHVVAGMMANRRGLGGLSDGKLYELEVLGIDPTGDVAMFRLHGRDDFSFAGLGDSDRVRVGDTAIAAGNPFTLSEDYSPTITTGLITGVHCYQWGVDENLTYSDCIQTDASINPGNSGGPLFNERGEIIGINGRISVNTRGRFNVGHGYAITSNQIRRFIPALRAGLLAKHGTLQATVARSGDGVVFDNVRTGFAADRAGVRIGDHLRLLDGIPIDTPNRFASVVGTYPENWSVALSVERDGELIMLHARFDAFEPKLPHPFVPDQQTVQQAVSRVLDSYRRALTTTAAGEAAFPERIQWTLSRSEQRPDVQTDRRESRYLVAWSKGHPLVMRPDESENSGGRIIEVDAESATQRHGTTGDRFDLPTDESMVLRGLYVGLIGLLVDVEGPIRKGIAHAGGDALPIEWTFGSRSRAPGVMEVLRIPLTEGFEADFGFDDASGLLASIFVRDTVSGATGSVTLSNYRDGGGVKWPTSVRIDLPKRTYTDRLSDISVSP